ncbi:MAG: hypothetical protein HC838_10905 [Spirulinaceae cyanobacterium RM2_2_10]|nr:hypothetical protein [Spirulinaceae cyanobacterium RM2_2_10]
MSQHWPRHIRQSQFWRRRGRDSFTLLSLAIAYALITHLVLAIPIQNNTVSIWPLWFPAGFAQAALLLLGRRFWPAIALGTFALTFASDVSWQYNAIAAANNSLQIWLGTVWLEQSGCRKHLPRPAGRCGC